MTVNVGALFWEECGEIIQGHRELTAHRDQDNLQRPPTGLWAPHTQTNTGEGEDDHDCECLGSRPFCLLPYSLMPTLVLCGAGTVSQHDQALSSAHPPLAPVTDAPLLIRP